MWTWASLHRRHPQSMDPTAALTEKNQKPLTRDEGKKEGQKVFQPGAAAEDTRAEMGIRSGTFLKTQGYFAPKHIVSPLPEEGERPTKIHRKYTVDGFVKLADVN